jgi:hypothetical protein
MKMVLDYRPIDDHAQKASASSTKHRSKFCVSCIQLEVFHGGTSVYKMHCAIQAVIVPTWWSISEDTAKTDGKGSSKLTQCIQ